MFCPAGSLDDYYSLLNDLAPPGKEDGATFFDFVAPRLATSHRKQVADVIHSFLSELWDEFDHSNAGILSLADLRNLCSWLARHQFAHCSDVCDLLPVHCA